MFRVKVLLSSSGFVANSEPDWDLGILRGSVLVISLFEVVLG
jgi:hypothetical protein